MNPAVKTAIGNLFVNVEKSDSAYYQITLVLVNN